MSNRADKIAGPIVRKGFKNNHSPMKIASDVRAALTAHRLPDGSSVHPVVIEDWVNEPARRIGMQRASNERKEARIRRLRMHNLPDETNAKFHRDAPVHHPTMAMGSLALSLAAGLAGLVRGRRSGRGS